MSNRYVSKVQLGSFLLCVSLLLKEANFETSTIIWTDTTAVSCCALEKGWDIIAQDSYRSPETVEMDEVLYVLDC